ncbi:MAG: hypothetical protein OJF49_003632 [Ktedonobacterales bacterium]|jgi:formylglycine-generating enzyme required for sulfatase activity/tetratricopeptide (TPR) repeat protein|nr:MAG: hypothetical protein OJF49_003632 [Ktedonobacterales bacterium]
MTSIFISYRRADSETIVGRIYDHLKNRYGKEAIFKDVDNIDPGEDFEQKIQAIIQQCAVQLAIIGPRWLDMPSAKTPGQRRLDEPKDPVLLEIEAAINAGIVIIPLLVERATMPDIDRLPDSISALAVRNGRPIRNDPDFEDDIGSLFAALDRYLQHVHAPADATPATFAGNPQAALVRQMLPDMERAFAAHDWQVLLDKADYLARYAPNALPAARFVTWGNTLLAESDVSGARMLLDAALGLNANGVASRPFTPADVPALRVAAQVHDQSGEQPLAATLLKDALALVADSDQRLAILREYLLVLQQTEQWNDLLRRTDEALRIAPGDPTIVALRVDALAKLRRTDEALAFIREFANRPDATTAGQLALARVLAEQSNPAEAWTILQAAMHNPNAPASVAQVRAKLFPPPSVAPRLAHLGYTGHNVAGAQFLIAPLCQVPAGLFRMGSDPRQDRDAQASEQPDVPFTTHQDRVAQASAQPAHDVTLPAYWIGRYPVTVAEYACFVRSGHTPGDWASQQSKLDHPVVAVSWHDAIAYAAWLATLTGQPWRLPTEAEWEKAARWDPQRRASRLYPWGDTFDESRANIYVGGKNGTTPVGSYPTGASPCGAQDMAGNVWEWNSSLYKPYPYSSTDGRENPDNSVENRVLRGGSWGDLAPKARAAYRNNLWPDYANGYDGFRLALSAGAGS